ncbi:hypothetical protein PBI_COUNT_58 [Microbacterium phage Count]|nr:hypothetical protein PBI_COUNT_58 [Microbacterium phage Count]
MDTRIVDLHANDIHVEIAGRQLAQIKVPSGYVPYSFMPTIEDHVILTGDKLVDGEIVLVEQTTFRANPDVLSPEYPSRKDGFRPSEYDRRRVQETARWALVTDSRIDENDILHFTAVYADGTAATRTYHKRIEWIVLREVEAKPVCECGEVHEENDSGYSLTDILTDAMAEFLQIPKELIVGDTEIRSDDEQTLPFQSNITFEGESVEEAPEEPLKKPKPEWVNGLTTYDLEENDWLPMAGSLYRIVGIQRNTGGIIATIKHLNDPDIPASTLFLSEGLTFGVKRRVY